MWDLQRERLKHLMAAAILELWKKETGSLAPVLIEGTICITSDAGKTTVVQVADKFQGTIPDRDGERRGGSNNNAKNVFAAGGAFLGSPVGGGSSNAHLDTRTDHHYLSTSTPRAGAGGSQPHPPPYPPSIHPAFTDSPSLMRLASPMSGFPDNLSSPAASLVSPDNGGPLRSARSRSPSVAPAQRRPADASVESTASPFSDHSASPPASAGSGPSPRSTSSSLDSSSRSLPSSSLPESTTAITDSSSHRESVVSLSSKEDPSDRDSGIGDSLSVSDSRNNSIASESTGSSNSRNNSTASESTSNPVHYESNSDLAANTQHKSPHRSSGEPDSKRRFESRENGSDGAEGDRREPATLDREARAENSFQPAFYRGQSRSRSRSRSTERSSERRSRSIERSSRKIMREDTGDMNCGDGRSRQIGDGRDPAQTRDGSSSRESGSNGLPNGVHETPGTSHDDVTNDDDVMNLSTSGRKEPSGPGPEGDLALSPPQSYTAQVHDVIRQRLLAAQKSVHSQSYTAQARDVIRQRLLAAGKSVHSAFNPVSSTAKEQGANAHSNKRDHRDEAGLKFENDPNNNDAPYLYSTPKMMRHDLQPKRLDSQISGEYRGPGTPPALSRGVGRPLSTPPEPLSLVTDAKELRNLARTNSLVSPSAMDGVMARSLAAQMGTHPSPLAYSLSFFQQATALQMMDSAGKGAGGYLAGMPPLLRPGSLPQVFPLPSPGHPGAPPPHLASPAGSSSHLPSPGSHRESPTDLSVDEDGREASTNGEQRTYRCEYCSKNFLFKSKYHEHLPVHTNARPFRCHLCARTYKYKYDLRVHLRTHMGIPTKSTVCPFCSGKFDTNKQLRAHIKDAHKDKQKASEVECTQPLDNLPPAL